MNIFINKALPPSSKYKIKKYWDNKTKFYLNINCNKIFEKFPQNQGNGFGEKE